MSDGRAQRRAIGDRLRKAREELHLSQAEVAGMVGIARSAISLIESGQRKVDALELARLAELFGRTEQFFIRGEETSPSSSLVDQHLARAISQLSDADKEAVLRFAQYQASQNKRDRT